ncbi:MAG: DNA-binding protein [Chitinophagales bacterium]
MKITFKELRKIKDNLPNGSMKQIASELDVSVETVRNYFGGSNYRKGEVLDIHYEAGPYGGIVVLNDTEILEIAKELVISQTEILV